MLTVLSARGTNYVNNGTSTAYVLYAGDSLILLAGDITGTIASTGARRQTPAPAPTFKPSSFSYFPGEKSTLVAQHPEQPDGQTSSFLLQNRGVVTVSGNVSLSNSAQFVNNYGGTITVNWLVFLGQLPSPLRNNVALKSDFIPAPWIDQLPTTLSRRGENWRSTVPW